MSGSFHETAVLQKFAGWAKLLWDKWNKYVVSGANTAAIQRQNQFRGYLNALCADVHICKVPSDFGALGACGEFSRNKWKLKIRNTEFSDDDVILEDYVEVCKTAIHELRHAEQYYRMAQGLYLGYIEFLPGTRKKKVSLVASPNAEVVTAEDIESAIDLPHDVAQDAINNSARYDSFATSARLAHCVVGKMPNRPNDKWTLTIDNMYQRRFKPAMKKWGQKGLDAAVGTLYDTQFYQRGELDTDTKALEALLEGLLKDKWLNYESKKDKGRKHACFAPAPALVHPPVQAHPPALVHPPALRRVA